MHVKKGREVEADWPHINNETKWAVAKSERTARNVLKRTSSLQTSLQENTSQLNSLARNLDAAWVETRSHIQLKETS